MSHIEQTITDLQAKLMQKEAEARKLKITINNLCDLADKPRLYPDAEDAMSVTQAGIRSDQFYGRPLATVVREVLEMRKAANLGAAAVGEVYGALVDGGFNFQTANEENAKRNLRISLAKNTNVFHRLPNGKWGLSDWYPVASRRVRLEVGNMPEESSQESAEDQGEGEIEVTAEK